MSPQVITETLYGLYKKGQGMPNKIHIITTTQGKEQAWLTLGVSQPNQPSMLEQFCYDYDLPMIQFEESDIWIVSDENDVVLDDASNTHEHNSMANFIVQKVQQLTANGMPPLHASLAGGRKTMTFFLGYAMSLFGRQSDELSHVLVSKGFENLRKFFYPTPFDYPIENQEGKMLNAKDAVVNLSNIPFVRMREDTPHEIINGQKTYMQIIDSMNQAKREPTLIIDTTCRTIECSGVKIKLPPQLFYFYLWLVEHYKKTGKGWIIPNEFGDPDHAYAYTEVYKTYDEKKDIELIQKSFDVGMPKSFFVTNKSKVNRVIKDKLGKHLGQHFVLSGVNEELSGPMQNGIKVKQNKIEIV